MWIEKEELPISNEEVSSRFQCSFLREILDPSGGCKEGAVRGTRAHLGFPILSISYSFVENLAKLYVGVPPEESSPPPRGKFWIFHWILCPFSQWRIQDLLERGTSPGGILFAITFAENCVKMKKKRTEKGCAFSHSYIRQCFPQPTHP